jgi:archaemetzincin
MSALHLYAFGEVEVSALQYLSIVLPEHFGVPCHIQDARLDASPAYIRDRNQHSSRSLLEILGALPRGPGEAVLGLAEVDITIPILTFVFGEALLGKDVALVGLHRLRQGFYGLPNDPDIFLMRAEKEALHELGHAAGLLHCKEYSCAMAFSNAVEQVDLKSPSFCPSCALRLSERWPGARF